MAMAASMRRNISILIVFVFLCILIISNRSHIQQASIHGVAQRIGMGEWSYQYADNATKADFLRSKPDYQPGVVGLQKDYRKVLVVPKTKREETEWMDEELPADIEKAIYIADDPNAPLHPPRNKGHEVMIYLTYIIDHFDSLPDIMIFMHAHRVAWHNADLFGLDASQMIKRLSPQRVIREGYVNMRCHWYPGCPDWMHPGETKFDEQKTEEILIAKAWAELFPLDPVPDVLAQPCCAQFAVSRERVQQIGLDRFKYYRQWLFDTPLQDFVSGRVWEYMWQFVFTGESFWCPVEHVCYCDGFGVCFGGEDEYNQWFEVRGQLDEKRGMLNEWNKKGEEIQALIDDGRLAEAKAMEQPEPGLDAQLQPVIEGLEAQLLKMVNDAIDRGNDPQNRALEAGREWKEGDGF